MMLLAPNEEVLYGGAAGGGKSVALLMAAAQYVHDPEYRAIILRRSLTDQKQSDILRLAKGWWFGNEPDWNGTELKWTFPSGATIEFGYAENQDDARRLKGATFHFIGFDELTELGDEQAYKYLFSRKRRAAGSSTPTRVWSATNPDGPGAGWVRKRWNLSGRVRQPVHHEGRLFLPAQIRDNPTLDADDYVKSLASLDPVTRLQILEGDWSAFGGGRFKPSWIKYYFRRGNLVYFDKKNYTDQQVAQRFIVVDPAATVEKSDKHDPDWTTIDAYGSTPSGLLVWLAATKYRCEIPDIPKLAAQQYLRWRARKAYVEGFGIGSGPAQLVKRYKLPGGGRMNCVMYNPEGKNKLANAADALNLAEAGRLWVPGEPDKDMEDALTELLAFTGDPSRDGHDDHVDNVSRAAKVFEGRPQGGALGVPVAYY